MAYVDKDIIEKARQIDLYSYLKVSAPAELVQCGANCYTTKEHDSLKISNGKWYWWSRGIGGVSALDYLVKVKEIDFVSAVNMLVKQTVITPSFSMPKAKKQKPMFMYVPPHNKECKTVKKYLLERGIDREIIEYFITQNQIAEDNKNGYALFFGNDNEGKHKQCSVRSTDNETVKKELYGSDRHYCFKSFSGKNITTLRVFESAIDLMSFATLMHQNGNDFKGENMMSLSGIYMPAKEIEKSKTPVAMIKILDENSGIKNIYLHLDSDYAGSQGAKGLAIALGENYNVKYIPPPNGKDFNEYLIIKNQREKTLKEREEER